MLNGISGSNSVPNVVSMLVRVAEERSAEIKEVIEKPKEQPKEQDASGVQASVASTESRQANSDAAQGTSIDIVV
ncbi:MAG: hypothetical protein OEL50_05085 [Rhodospirillaceae bacterium]|nr:hypothetical protein [Rhodospirillaceae bacterium]